MLLKARAHMHAPERVAAVAAVSPCRRCTSAARSLRGRGGCGSGCGGGLPGARSRGPGHQGACWHASAVAPLAQCSSPPCPLVQQHPTHMFTLCASSAPDRPQQRRRCQPSFPPDVPHRPAVGYISYTRNTHQPDVLREAQHAAHHLLRLLRRLQLALQPEQCGPQGGRGAGSRWRGKGGTSAGARAMPAPPPRASGATSLAHTAPASGRCAVPVPLHIIALWYQSLVPLQVTCADDWVSSSSALVSV